MYIQNVPYSTSPQPPISPQLRDTVRAMLLYSRIRLDYLKQEYSFGPATQEDLDFLRRRLRLSSDRTNALESELVSRLDDLLGLSPDDLNCHLLDCVKRALAARQGDRARWDWLGGMAIAALLATGSVAGFRAYQHLALLPSPLSQAIAHPHHLLPPWPPLDLTYETALRPQVLAANLEEAYFLALCQSWAAYQGLVWAELSPLAQLTLARQLFTTLSMGLRPATLEQLGRYDRPTVNRLTGDRTATQLDKKETHLIADGRLHQLFPPLGEPEVSIHGTPFEQVWFALLEDVIVEQSFALHSTPVDLALQPREEPAP